MEKPPRNGWSRGCSMNGRSGAACFSLSPYIKNPYPMSYEAARLCSSSGSNAATRRRNSDSAQKIETKPARGRRQAAGEASTGTASHLCRRTFTNLREIAYRISTPWTSGTPIGLSQNDDPVGRRRSTWRVRSIWWKSVDCFHEAFHDWLKL